MTTNPTCAVLFVCLGNICRSPLAEGVFRHVAGHAGMADRFVIDSAGTGAWHTGSPPDPRSIDTAGRYGIDISMQRARRITAADFSRFDLILGMDESNVATLRAAAPDAGERIHLFVEYATGQRREVPDPYYGGPGGFTEIYRMILEASEALVPKLIARDASIPASGQTSSTT